MLSETKLKLRSFQILALYRCQWWRQGMQQHILYNAVVWHKEFKWLRLIVVYKLFVNMYYSSTNIFFRRPNLRLVVVSMFNQSSCIPLCAALVCRHCTVDSAEAARWNPRSSHLKVKYSVSHQVLRSSPKVSRVSQHNGLFLLKKKSCGAREV